MEQNTNPNLDENQMPEPKPVFEEIENMTEDVAMDTLMSAVNYAQTKGIFSVRDSVYVAKAISVIRPGSI